MNRLRDWWEGLGLNNRVILIASAVGGLDTSLQDGPCVDEQRARLANTFFIKPLNQE